ncbi:MAG TPA: beta-agarase, partial [Lentisphaeria bacterium]|nr:beta-agarase [Lentisphaeria bacterium]
MLKLKTLSFAAGMLLAPALLLPALAAELKLAPEQVKARYRASAKLEKEGIRLITRTAEWDSGALITPPAGKKFDFSKARFLAVDVENLSPNRQMRLTMHISSGGRDKASSSHVDLPLRSVNTGIGLNPGEKRTMRLYLPHASLFTAPKDGRNLRAPLDTTAINGIEFKLQWPFEAEGEILVDCRLSNLRLEGEPETDRAVAAAKNYFPFIDDYGQYRHAEWKEKIHADSDLVANHKKELAELDAAQAPAEWDSFGGWKNGPALKATGNFRTEKYQGKWFFVDPEGHLFWSIGLDVSRTHTDATPGRKHPQWFSRPVPADGMLPFTHWNLQKKYGKADYSRDFFETLVKRYRAWGINTIGNWSAPAFMELGKVPYVLSLGDFVKDFPRFRGSKVKFYDVF